MGEAFAQGGGGEAGGTLTSVIRSRHQAKAAYRLLDRPQVTHAAVIGGHGQEVLQATATPGHYLLIEDTTTVAYRDPTGMRGLGPIGEEFTRGLWVHSTLVVRDDAQKNRQELLGLLGQQVWVRPVERPKDRPPSTGRGKENNHRRQLRPERESQRWMVHLETAGGPLGDTTWTYVADRESDIYELFQSATCHGWNYVIRASHPRALAQAWAGRDLFQAAAQGTIRGHLDLELPKDRRTTSLEVRSTTLELRGPDRPGGRLENHRLQVVWVQEVKPPRGQDPLRWVLLTDLPVQTMAQCRNVIRLYRGRWLIEEFHKALKTGLKIEASQLSDVRRLSALIGILSVVAMFLLQHKLAARADPQARLKEDQIDPILVKVLRKIHPPDRPPQRSGKRGPPRPLTSGWFWIAIAKLGGFQGRPSDGDPGWLTLWRGWQTLMLLARGYELANSS